MLYVHFTDSTFVHKLNLHFDCRVLHVNYPYCVIAIVTQVDDLNTLFTSGCGRAALSVTLNTVTLHQMSPLIVIEDTSRGKVVWWLGINNEPLS